MAVERISLTSERSKLPADCLFGFRSIIKGWRRHPDTVYHVLSATAVAAITFAGYEAIKLTLNPQTPSLIRNVVNLIGRTP